MVDIEVVEPDQDDLDEDEQERVEFLTTGGVRCQIRGVWYRLRRPNLGELKDLNLALEAITDELTPFAQEQASLSKELGEQLKELQAKAQTLENSPDATDADTQALAEGLAEIQTRQRKAITEITARSWELREQWGQRVFKALKPKGTKIPAQMPTWIVNPEIGPKLVEHWMRVPLGPGR